jgi:hypothetical protein
LVLRFDDFPAAFDNWDDTKVISPYRQFSELALVDNSGSSLREGTRKFA